MATFYLNSHILGLEPERQYQPRVALQDTELQLSTSTELTTRQCIDSFILKNCAVQLLVTGTIETVCRSRPPK